jgi:hypothetical protein
MINVISYIYIYIYIYIERERETEKENSGYRIDEYHRLSGLSHIP